MNIPQSGLASREIYQMKIMLIEWDDTCSGTGWESRGSKETISPVVSVGILVEETEKQVEIIPNLGIAHKLHQIAIPKGAIKRIRKLSL